jgi:hypothetical protein
MTKTRSTIALAALAATAALGPQNAVADHHEMTGLGPFITSWACDYREGRSREDLVAAGDYFREQVARIDDADMNQGFAAIVSPVWSGFDRDVWFLSASPDLRTATRAGTAYNQSRQGQAANERFAEVIDCTNSTYLSHQVHDGMDGTPTPGAMVFAEIFACGLRDGHRVSDLDGADAYYSRALAGMDAPVDAFRWTPMWSNTPADVVYMVVHPSMIALGETTSSMAMSEYGEMVEGWYGELVDCESGVFSIQVVRAPEAG